MAADNAPVHKLQGFQLWREGLNGAQFIVAPMVDQSELAWRLLSRRHGAQLCYTPMYHASQFVRCAKYRREALATTSEDRPLIVQFCANDPQTFLKAAQHAAPLCDAIDLNLGCPQSIAKRGHYGAFLQDEWDLLREMVSTCHQHLSVPITCKVRVFEEIDKTIKYAQMLESAGCQLLTVHGRTKEQKGRDTGIASWAHIKAVRENVSIPVFANGNIQYVEDVHRCIAETGVQGVMSAESNLHDPALFSGEQTAVWDIAEEYLEIYRQHPCPTSYIRGHMYKLFHHPLHENPDLREVLAKAREASQFASFISTIKDRCKEDMEKYAADPTSLKSRLPRPYWICQPYVRPSSENETEEEKQVRKERRNETQKRTHEVALNGDLSINKVKRLIKNPYKSEKGRAAYIPCVACGNPKSLKCEQNMCKKCCKATSRKEVLNCVGHNLWFKNWKLNAEREAAGEDAPSQETPRNSTGCVNAEREAAGEDATNQETPRNSTGCVNAERGATGEEATNQETPHNSAGCDRSVNQEIDNKKAIVDSVVNESTRLAGDANAAAAADASADTDTSADMDTASLQDENNIGDPQKVMKPIGDSEHDTLSRQGTSHRQDIVPPLQDKVSPLQDTVSNIQVTEGPQSECETIEVTATRELETNTDSGAATIHP